MNVLVIAPHPDDEVIGCGGTIAKLVVGGKKVFLCIATKGTEDMYAKDVLEEKHREVLRLQKFLGIKEVFFLDFPTQKLDTVPSADIFRAIYNVVNKIKPEIVFLPHKADIAKDHRVVFESALFTLRPKPGYAPKKILSYECISETEWTEQSAETAFMPNVYEDISGFLEKKLDAMKIYKTEIQKFPHPRSVKGLKASAEKRGTEIGVKAAEAFMLVREVNK